MMISNHMTYNINEKVEERMLLVDAELKTKQNEKVQSRNLKFQTRKNSSGVQNYSCKQRMMGVCYISIILLENMLIFSAYTH